MPNPFRFDLLQVDSIGLAHGLGVARRGTFQTPHGPVETPAFMPVGTQGAVKGVTHREMDSLGAEIMLSNTYHLYLRPGDDLIARRGGLHRFIGWTKPILTDSGGYQVFSLSNRRTIDEAGAHFRSLPKLTGMVHGPISNSTRPAKSGPQTLMVAPRLMLMLMLNRPRSSSMPAEIRAYADTSNQNGSK